MHEKEIKPANKIVIIIISLLVIMAVLLWINYILLKSVSPVETVTIQSLNEFKLKSVTKSHLLFSNIMITKEKDEYIVTSKVTNLTSNILNITPVKMIFKDSRNNTIAQITSYLGNTIKEEESKTLYIQTNINLLDARKVDVEVQTNI